MEDVNIGNINDMENIGCTFYKSGCGRLGITLKDMKSREINHQKRCTVGSVEANPIVYDPPEDIKAKYCTAPKFENCPLFREKMANKLGTCPICGQTISYYEILRTEKDEFIITNHHLDNSICHVKSEIKISLVSRSGKKRDGSPEYEIIEAYKKNDHDHPGTETIEFCYLNHNNNPTSAFHVVKYTESGELKHIDCKLCGNDWKIQSGRPIEDYFALEQKNDVSFIESLKIKCLKCNAMFDASNATK